MRHPVKLVVRDDLARSRASVFFRLLLAIPHLLWLSLWTVAVLVLLVPQWLIVLVAGRPSHALHGFLSRYLRCATHVGAYVTLLADPYPPFLGAPGYAVDVEIAPPGRQNRWTVLFRLLLAVPAALIGSALAGAGVYGDAQDPASYATGLLVAVAFLGWFASLARARMPQGMRDAGAYALSYGAQLTAYLLLLTGRYPDSDPLAALDGLPARERDPIRLEVEDDLRRSRLTVFFRLLLAIPHFIWLSLWGIAAMLATVGNWFATLVRGRSPDALHRFLGAYLRYATHVMAYVTLIANPFPGFGGRPGSYPVDLTIAPRERQGRWGVFFRLLLAFPALAISGAYGTLLFAAALLAWFAALVLGRVPRGLRNAAALSLRYSQQLYGYAYLLTPVYPYSGPTAPASAAPAPSPTAPQPPSLLPLADAPFVTRVT